MEDGALRLSAALAYYSIFSLAPLLLIAIGIAGFFGQDMSPPEIRSKLSGAMGPQMAGAAADLAESASKSAKGATIVGFITLIIGASGVFGQLKDALNTIWEVKQKAGAGIKGFIRERLLTFGMVLVIGFLLLISLLIGAVIAGFSGWMEQKLGIPGFVAGLIGFVFSFAIETLLFALIFRVLPDAEVEWRSVWIGAAVTAVLFEIGKWGLSLYLGSGSATSSFGAAGSVVLVLLWVYYTSLILFFGAEFTQVFAKAMGHEIRPSPNAEPVTAEQRAQQGLPPGVRDAPSAPVPEFITVPVYSPPPAPAFPRSLEEVPQYLRESPMASLVTAAGCGFTVGLIARAIRRAEPDRTPTQEIAHGSKALALATLPLLTSVGRRVAAEAIKRLRPADWWKAARHAANATASVARKTQRVKEWIAPAVALAISCGLAA